MIHSVVQITPVSQSAAPNAPPGPWDSPASTYSGENRYLRSLNANGAAMTGAATQASTSARLIRRSASAVFDREPAAPRQEALRIRSDEHAEDHEVGREEERLDLPVAALEEPPFVRREHEPGDPAGGRDRGHDDEEGDRPGREPPVQEERERRPFQRLQRRHGQDRDGSGPPPRVGVWSSTIPCGLNLSKAAPAAPWGLVGDVLRESVDATTGRGTDSPCESLKPRKS